MIGSSLGHSHVAPRVCVPAVFWCAALLGVVAPVGAGPLPRVELVDHVIVQGESCEEISRNQYGSEDLTDLIHDYNPWLGPVLPYCLQPGKRSCAYLPGVRQMRGSPR